MKEMRKRKQFNTGSSSSLSVRTPVHWFLHLRLCLPRLSFPARENTGVTRRNKTIHNQTKTFPWCHQLFVPHDEYLRMIKIHQSDLIETALSQHVVRQTLRSPWIQEHEHMGVFFIHRCGKQPLHATLS